MESVLKKSNNRFSCVGTVYENNLKKEPCDVKIKDSDGAVVNTVKGEKISGTILVATADGTHVFRVYCQTPTSAGEENPMWKNHLDMLELIPQVHNKTNEEPSVVQVNGVVDVNDYYSERKQKVENSLQWRVNSISTRVSEEEETGCRLDIVGYLHKMTQEVNKNGEETGRLKMLVYAVDRNSCAFPLEILVDSNISEEVEDYYEVGQTLDLTLERRVITQGKLQKAKRGPSSGKNLPSNAVHSVTDALFYNEGDIIEEPDELTTEDEKGNEVEVDTDWINPKAMKKALQQRNEKLEKILNDGRSGKNKKKSAEDSKKNNNTGGKKRNTRQEALDDFNEDEEESSANNDDDFDDEDF